MSWSQWRSRQFDKMLGRLRHRLLRTIVVDGDTRRLEVDSTASCQDAIFNTRSGMIRVGSNSFFGHGVMILTGTHDLDLTDQAARKTSVPKSGRDIYIGMNVWIGSGAIVIGPCTIGDGAVVAAGAVVRGDVASGDFVGGVPARPLLPRQAEDLG